MHCSGPGDTSQSAELTGPRSVISVQMLPSVPHIVLPIFVCKSLSKV